MRLILAVPIYSTKSVDGVFSVVCNGKPYSFIEHSNITQPCSVCGVPACGREDVIWYQYDGRKIGLIYDGAELDLAIELFMTYRVGEYDELPDFIRSWNESIGWSECWDYSGFLLDVADFKVSLELLTHSPLEEWCKASVSKMMSEMKQLINMAEINNSELRIVRG